MSNEKKILIREEGLKQVNNVSIFLHQSMQTSKLHLFTKMPVTTEDGLHNTKKQQCPMSEKCYKEDITSIKDTKLKAVKTSVFEYGNI